jgi:hypothetical protein
VRGALDYTNEKEEKEEDADDMHFSVRCFGVFVEALF